MTIGSNIKSRRIAIIGAGGIGLGYFAMLKQAGHAPVFWSPSGRSTQAFLAGEALGSSGLVSGTFPTEVARTSKEAVEDAEIVLIAVPAYGHRSTMESLAPYLSTGQTVIISGHLSFSALYLSKMLAKHKVEVPIVTLSAPVLVSYRRAPAMVDVQVLRKSVPAACLPTDSTEKAAKTCSDLFTDRLTWIDDLLTGILSNLNPTVHIANTLCNLTRIERGEKWANYGGMTAAVGHLVEQLDAERLSTAAAFGRKVLSANQQMRLWFDLDEGGTFSEMCQTIDIKRGQPPGPTSLDTRHITEDVPFGAFPLELLGKIAQVPTPLHSSHIALFSALYRTDFRLANDLVPALSLEGRDRKWLIDAARFGWH
jgi:opine dehydrogenase